MNKLPVSAMVVGYNEAHFLEGCLQSVAFCDELIYIDLGSDDNSAEIAGRYADKIIYRDRAEVPSGEIAQADAVKLLKNEWVVFIDPDEKVDPVLSAQLISSFSEITADVQTGAVLVPWQFYFRNRKLKGTVWGGRNSKYLLVNKNRFDFLPVTHYGRKLKPGFKIFEISENAAGTNLLHHYWMNHVRIFLQKHRRYLKKEGLDQYNLGIRTGKKNLLLSPFKAFGNSFFQKKGYRDGFTGLFLSVFWAYYKTKSLLDIYRIQKKIKQTSAGK